MNRHQAQILIVVFVVLLAGTFLQSYSGRAAQVTSSRAGCERSKLDRAANAAGWTAHARYIAKVTVAASVKEDVKRAAREAARTYSFVSADLSKRSKLNCAKTYPAASLLP